MNQHQILTGAVNAGDNCYSVGSVEGVPFTAYAAGCNMVILASDFTRVQIMPGILHGNVQISCMDASTDVGKIAVAYGKKVCIFEPTPLLDRNSSHKLDYKWIQTASLESDCQVSVISWNLEGTKILTGGAVVQMWHLVSFPDDTSEGITINANRDETSDSDKIRWDCIWRCRTATPVFFLRFSPDGSLFISAGKSDRLVKIWYESAAKKCYINSFSSGPAQNVSTGPHPMSETTYSFVYIAHPRAVTGISWRKTSKYTPRGCNANMIVTSSRDNIARLWVQTLLPDDGMVNFSQIEGLADQTVPRVSTQRNRQKILSRIRAIRTFNQLKKRQQAAKGSEDDVNVDSNQPIPNLPSTFSVHDFHTFGIHGTAMSPGLHFHLAASINAETDIPLVPSLSSHPVDERLKPNFVMHWMNNKEMVFTQMAEKIIHEMSLRIFQESSGSNLINSNHQDDNQNIEADSETGVEPQFDADDTITAESGKKLRHKLCTTVNSCKKKSKTGDDDQNEPLHTTPSSGSLKSEGVASSNTQEPMVNGVTSTQLGDYVDRKFEAMIREWHSTSDLLFSIHPVDGSLLVWYVLLSCIIVYHTLKNYHKLLKIG